MGLPENRASMGIPRSQASSAFSSVSNTLLWDNRITKYHIANYVCMYVWMDGCVKFHRHCACGVVLFHRCLTFVLLSNCPSIVHDRCIVFLWQIV